MMKLYMFQCGSIRTRKHLLLEGTPVDEWLEVPVPFFLIEHPKGNILFDTGMPLRAATSVATGNYIPVMNEEDHVSKQLAKTGLKPEDISHIVLSHLHCDHAGGIEAFSSVECFIQKDELTGDNWNFTDRCPQYWHRLNGDYDIFGDGKIWIIPTPGHSPGHQSLLVKLEYWGDTLLAADSLYVDEILDKDVLPGVFYKQDETISTINMIRKMRQNNTRIIAGHDSESWTTYNLAPTHYN